MSYTMNIGNETGKVNVQGNGIIIKNPRFRWIWRYNVLLDTKWFKDDIINKYIFVADENNHIVDCDVYHNASIREVSVIPRQAYSANITYHLCFSDKITYKNNSPMELVVIEFSLNAKGKTQKPEDMPKSKANSVYKTVEEYNSKTIIPLTRTQRERFHYLGDTKGVAAQWKIIWGRYPQISIVGKTPGGQYGLHFMAIDNSEVYYYRLIPNNNGYTAKKLSPKEQFNYQNQREKEKIRAGADEMTVYQLPDKATDTIQASILYELLKNPLEIISASSVYEYVDEKNPIGSKYDLAKDNAFFGRTVYIINLPNISLEYTQFVLKQKGFGVITDDSVPKIGEFNEKLSRSCQLWIISDSGTHIDTESMKAINDYFERGYGVYLWGDNNPLYVAANDVSKTLVGVEMHGNYEGTKEVKVISASGDTQKGGIVTNHPISKDNLLCIYEGCTIANVETKGEVKPLIYSSDGNVVTAYYESGDKKKRLLIDGGWTRLYMACEEAGTGRYIKNAAAWLANEDKRLQKKFL